MKAWVKLLAHLLAILPFLIAVNLGGAEAKQRLQKLNIGQNNSAIIGEVDESDIIPMDDDFDEDEDEGIAASSHSQQSLKTQKKGVKKKAQSAKEKKQEREKARKAAQAAQKRKKLMEGFKKAEEFHKTWFHMPFPKIKTSLQKLTQFCKGACSKSQCSDKDIANNCHLMCPESTTKQCADPLRQEGSDTLDTEDFIESDEALSTDMMNEDDLENASPSSLTDQDHSIIRDGDGEEE